MSAYAKKVCPIDGEVFPDDYNFCTKHGVKLKEVGVKKKKSGKRVMKIYVLYDNGKREVMKFRGFNTDCDGYGKRGIKYTAQGVTITIPWRDVKYILPGYNTGVLKSGKTFKTDSLKPSYCGSAYISEKRKKKVRVLDYEKTKETTVRIDLSDMEVIAFSRKGRLKAVRGRDYRSL